jgi:hypothetical protein
MPSMMLQVWCHRMALLVMLSVMLRYLGHHIVWRALSSMMFLDQDHHTALRMMLLVAEGGPRQTDCRTSW